MPSPVLLAFVLALLAAACELLGGQAQERLAGRVQVRELFLDLGEFAGELGDVFA